MKMMLPIKNKLVENLLLENERLCFQLHLKCKKLQLLEGWANKVFSPVSRKLVLIFKSVGLLC